MKKQRYKHTLAEWREIQKTHNTRLGAKLSEETKRKISDSHIGKKYSQEYKDNMREVLKEKTKELYKDKFIDCKLCFEKTPQKIFNQLYCPECKRKLAQIKLRERMKANGKAYIRLRTREKIPFSKECDICHGTEGLQRHHWNYDKPLMVNTLCKTCHEIQHVKDFPAWLEKRLIKDKEMEAI